MLDKTLAAAIKKHSASNDNVLVEDKILSLSLFREAEFEPFLTSIDAVMTELAAPLFELDRLDLARIMSEEMTPYRAYMLGRSQLTRLRDEISAEYDFKVDSLTKSNNE